MDNEDDVPVYITEGPMTAEQIQQATGVLVIVAPLGEGKTEKAMQPFIGK